MGQAGDGIGDLGSNATCYLAVRAEFVLCGARGGSMRIHGLVRVDEEFSVLWSRKAVVGKGMVVDGKFEPLALIDGMKWNYFVVQSQPLFLKLYGGGPSSLLDLASRDSRTRRRVGMSR